ncbi:MAG: hypothetical protein VR67_17150 [Peptococcaceae bacterium BRH_c8a]|nr:MAG: hypothetical protein VR67_17150 [Peptococcaceae bacterium BRH_c8a]
MKKLPLSNMSITFKIAISLGMLIAFLMLTLGIITAYQMNETVQVGEKDKGSYLTEALSGQIINQLQAGNYQPVKQNIRQFISEFGMEGAIVVNAQGKIVVIEGLTRANHMMAMIGDLKGFDSTGYSAKYIKEQDEANSAFLFIRAIKDEAGQPMGYLGLSSSAGYLHRNTNSLVYLLGGITIAAIIAGIFLSMIISRRILNRPIIALAAATENIATGNFSMKVNSRNQDELGNLASSFNTMTGYLSNLFRSITTYTGELVKSCQSLSTAVKSSESASKKLTESMQEHAGRTGEHISMLRGCADLAQGLVERVERSGQALRRSANEIAAIAGDAQEPARLMYGAADSIEDVQCSLERLKNFAGDNLAAFDEMKQLALVFSDYLDRSRAFNFNLALEVAKLGGQDLTRELNDLQQMSDEGMEKTRGYIASIDNAGQSVESMLKALDDNLGTVEQGKKALVEAGACWNSLGGKLVAESDVIDGLMDSMAENEKQRGQLLESLGYLMEELDKALREFNGTGEAGERQTEQLGQLESTMRRILRVSNALNNLCLQFKI